MERLRSPLACKGTSARREGQLDVPGAVTVTAGVALLVLAVARAGDTLRVTQPALLGAAAVLMLAAFVIREMKAPAPLLDLALLRDRGIAGANLTRRDRLTRRTASPWRAGGQLQAAGGALSRRAHPGHGDRLARMEP